MQNNIIGPLATEIEGMKEQLFSDLEKLISIKSVKSQPESAKPFGKDIDDALNYVILLAERMGFKATNHEGYIGVIEWGDSSESIGILSHVDVVPPGDIEAWDSPPFQLTEKEGYICGRGVVDDKGPLLSALYGAYALRNIGFQPRRKVKFIIGTDEENSWEGIEYYKRHFSSPEYSFSPDGMFTVVNREKGIVGATYKRIFPNSPLISLTGGEARNLVPAKAIAVLDLNKLPGNEIDQISSEDLEISRNGSQMTITSKGKSAPSMAPQKGENAILKLINFILEKEILGKRENEILSFMNLVFGGSNNCSDVGLFLADQESGELTINLGKIELENNLLILTVDARVPVTFSPNSFTDDLSRLLLKEDFVIDEKTIKQPHYVNPDSQLIQKLCAVYETVTNESPVLHSIGGGTYARAFENCVCFGSVYPGEQLTVHSPNERVLKSNLIKNTLVYGAAIAELSLI